MQYEELDKNIVKIQKQFQPTEEKEKIVVSPYGGGVSALYYFHLTKKLKRKERQFLQLNKRRNKKEKSLILKLCDIHSVDNVFKSLVVFKSDFFVNFVIRNLPKR
jgi:hypothetical protein